METSKERPFVYVPPQGPEITYVPRYRKGTKFLLTAGVVAVVLGLGLAWFAWFGPQVSDQRRAQGSLRLCCMNELKAAQHGLTQLASESQKLRIRLVMGVDPPAQKIVSALMMIEEQAKNLWDQLDAIMDDRGDNIRRQSRDVSITFEALKQHLQIAERCCGLPADVFLDIRGQFQTVESNLQTIDTKMQEK